MDDLSEYDTIFSHHVQIGTISMRKEFVNTHFPYLNRMINKVYTDTNGLLTDMIKQLTNHIDCYNRTIEAQLIETIKLLSFEKQTEVPKKLSKKESLIFDIRTYLIEHAEENISIEDLALKFGMSDKTLQIIFKKIFGHTPKKFMKLLKLNLAYRDITEDNRSSETISKIAMKYGFNNFGLFSQKFKTMYGILPSKIG
jgi:AraC-like DNA-binding protein